MKQINLRLADDVLVDVDEARGDVPRQKWLEHAVAAALGGASGIEPRGESPRAPGEYDPLGAPSSVAATATLDGPPPVVARRHEPTRQERLNADKERARARKRSGR